MPEENPVWDRPLEERNARAANRPANAPAGAQAPLPAPPVQAKLRQQVPLPLPEPGRAEGVTDDERSHLWAPSAEEEAEARRVVLNALSRDSGGGMLVAAALLCVAAGASLIWVGTRGPGAVEEPLPGPGFLDAPEAVVLAAPEGTPTTAVGVVIPPAGDIDFGPEPSEDDFEGPEPEI